MSTAHELDRALHTKVRHVLHQEGWLAGGTGPQPTDSANAIEEKGDGVPVTVGELGEADCPCPDPKKKGGVDGNTMAVVGGAALAGVVALIQLVRGV